jgi:hypothetical protein
MKFTPEEIDDLIREGRARPTTDGVLVDGAVIEERRRVEAILTDEESIKVIGKEVAPEDLHPKLVASLDQAQAAERERRGEA